MLMQTVHTLSLSQLLWVCDFCEIMGCQICHFNTTIWGDTVSRHADWQCQYLSRSWCHGWRWSCTSYSAKTCFTSMSNQGHHCFGAILGWRTLSVSVHAYRAWTWMGAFGAPSPKGTTLWSSRPAVQKMSRSLPAGKTWSDDITTRTVLKSGKPSVSGGKGLKESQAYTSQFGFATLSVWLEEDEWPEPEWLRSRFQTFGLHWLRKTGGMMHVFKKWCSISLPISLANQPWGVSQHCISTFGMPIWNWWWMRVQNHCFAINAHPRLG